MFPTKIKTRWESRLSTQLNSIGNAVPMQPEAPPSARLRILSFVVVLISNQLLSDETLQENAYRK